MRIIVAPAKKMSSDTDSLPPDGLPQFLPEAEQLLSVLRSMTDEELQTLWKCSDGIAALNRERVRSMDLRRRLTPAILSYTGIQYQYMAPGVFETGQFAFLQEHLRIVSGFYGLLRPFDGVTPYRLEMQAKLCVDGCNDLYTFWGGKLAQALTRETDFVLNLASREYSRAVEPHLPSSVHFLSCVFGELKDGKIIEKGVRCKMARGRMVRYLAENDITDAQMVKEFHDLGYQYAAEYSEKDRYVFLIGDRSGQGCWGG